jgi:FkbM family methyltransferase
MEWQEVDLFGRYFRVAGHPDDEAFFKLKSVVSAHKGLAALAGAVLTPNSNVCDIGANLGVTSLMLAGQVPHGRVYAFEPSPKTAACLRATVAASGLNNIDTIEAAIGAGQERVSLHVADTFSAGTHIVTQRHLSCGAMASATVEMNTLDFFLQSKDAGKIDLIKIDTEGFEIDVIMGAKDTLGKFKPVVNLEMNSWCLMAFRNINPRHFIESLLNYFPMVFWFTPSGKLRLIKHTGELYHFLHEHLVRQSAVTELVCCWQRDWVERFAPGVEN